MSKLISVPNQFANKLKEKAEDFERKRDVSPNVSRERIQASPFDKNNVSGLY
jgi:hypothetical protein